jgi:GTP cyclohydrolase I
MKQDEEIHDEIGENHIGSCATNPVRDDAFLVMMKMKKKRC